MQLSGLWNKDSTPDEAFAPDRISHKEPSAPDSVSNGNIAVQFISKFGLQKQAMAFQDGINSVVDTINSLLGDTSKTKVSTVNRKLAYC